MKTLYEILEVSENASKEIIDRSYRVLVKKYHPDLQPPENREEAENHMKEINEAYETLGDEAKRHEYDSKLTSERQKEQAKTSESQYSQNRQYTNYTNSQTERQNYGQAQNSNQRPMTEEEYKQAQRRQQDEIRRQKEMQEQIQRNIQAQYEKKYQEAYEGYLRSLGYRIRYKWTWKNYRDFFITILILIGICAILWFFPPTNKLIMDFYNSSPIIKSVIDIIGAILKGIWNSITSIFK